MKKHNISKPTMLLEYYSTVSKLPEHGQLKKKSRLKVVIISKNNKEKKAFALNSS